MPNTAVRYGVNRSRIRNKLPKVPKSELNAAKKQRKGKAEQYKNWFERFWRGEITANV